jgi:hypothetical protein
MAVAIPLLILLLAWLLLGVMPQKQITYADMQEKDWEIGMKFQHKETKRIVEVCGWDDLAVFQKDKNKWIKIN